jgi:hypothetical protein
MVFGGRERWEQPPKSNRVNGIGTWPCKAGYDVGWGADDAVVCFTFFYVPLLPLRPVHIWGEKEAWLTTRAAIIPIRWSGTLVAQVLIRGWTRVFLAFGIFFGVFNGLLTVLMSKPPLHYVQAFWFIGVPTLVIWLIGSFWSSRRADRPCKIRILLGPHTFGTSDPATWLDDTVARSIISSLEERLGAESFSQAAEQFLKRQDFRSAMWAARVSTVCEDRGRGERLTDQILGHPRVSEALEKIRPTASFWKRPL